MGRLRQDPTNMRRLRQSGLPASGGSPMTSKCESQVLTSGPIPRSRAVPLRRPRMIADGRLISVLDNYAPTVSGQFLYYPSRGQNSAALRAFIVFMRLKVQKSADSDAKSAA